MDQDWREVRVFLSSTFRDTHGERDVLTRKIFPRLREWASTRCVKLLEVDLRWGVTDSDPAVQVCLEEIDRADIFLCLLGHRYGWRPKHFGVEDTDLKHQWVKDFPEGKSVTELEIHRACLNPPEHRSPSTVYSLFYLRADDFLKGVPPEALSEFADAVGGDSTDSAERLKELKAAITREAQQREDIDVVKNYPCEPPQLVEGKYMVQGLQEWGEHVYQSLKNIIAEKFPQRSSQHSGWKMAQELTLHRWHARASSFDVWGREQLVTELVEVAEDCDMAVNGAGELRQPMPLGSAVVVHGEEGVGKTAVLASLVMRLSEEYALADPIAAIEHKVHKNLVPCDSFVFTHFTGIGPGTSEPRVIIQRACRELASVLCQRIRRRVNDKDEVFYDVLQRTGPPGGGGSGGSDAGAEATWRGYTAKDMRGVVKGPGGRPTLDAALRWLRPAWMAIESAFAKGQLALHPADSVWPLRIPSELRDLRALLWGLLSLSSLTLQRCVFVFDAVDEITNGFESVSGTQQLTQLLGFLPSRSQLGPNLYVAVSINSSLLATTASSSAVDPQLLLQWFAHKGYRGVELERLSAGNVEKVIVQRLARYGKKLTKPQLDLLLSLPSSSLPKWLTVALEEVRVYHDYETLSLRLQGLPPDLNGLLHQMLERLEGDHGIGLVRDACSVVLATQVGGTSCFAVYSAVPLTLPLLASLVSSPLSRSAAAAD